LNIMHWLSRQLEPPTTAVAAGFIYVVPQRRRLLPRLLLLGP
jgi:hypothetical protein